MTAFTKASTVSPSLKLASCKLSLVITDDINGKSPHPSTVILIRDITSLLLISVILPTSLFLTPASMGSPPIIFLYYDQIWENKFKEMLFHPWLLFDMFCFNYLKRWITPSSFIPLIMVAVIGNRKRPITPRSLAPINMQSKVAMG